MADAIPFEATISLHGVLLGARQSKRRKEVHTHLESSMCLLDVWLGCELLHRRIGKFQRNFPVLKFRYHMIERYSGRVGYAYGQNTSSSTTRCTHWAAHRKRLCRLPLRRSWRTCT